MALTEVPAQPDPDPAPEPEKVPKYANPRVAVVDLLRKRLEARLQEVEGGSWDGVRVVTAKDLAEALAGDLPPASLFSAEVRTPARIAVDAVCPRCGIPSTIGVEIHPELVVDDDGAELRVKAKAKARTHLCGQTRLDEAADSDQMSFEIGDIVGSPDASEVDFGEGAPADADEGVDEGPQLDLGACPWPGCDLAADHPGAHGTMGDDTDDDLLP